MTSQLFVLLGSTSFAICLAACSNGGGAPPVSALRATLTFPTSGAVTDEARVLVRGTTSGPGATSVDVDGVPATTDDGFRTWEATVALQPGANHLVVGLTDDEGLRRGDAAVIEVRRVGEVLVGPGPLAAEPAGGSWLVADVARQAILRVRAADGTSAVVSDAETGQGPQFAAPSAMVHDPGADRVYVADAVLRAVLEVDPHTGDRQILSDENAASRNGLDGIFTGISALLLDGANRRLVAAAVESEAVFAIELDTGAVRLIAGGSNAAPVFRRGSGPNLLAAVGIALDEPGNRAILADDQAQRIVAVDLTSGDRQILSSNSAPSQPTGPDFRGPLAIALDASRRFAFVADRGRLGGRDWVPAGVLRVDLATGMRSPLGSPTSGSSGELLAPAAIAVDPAGERLLVGDPLLGALVAVELAAGAEGARSVAGALVGHGQRFVDPDACALDRIRRRLLVLDPELGLLLAVDLGNGDRTVVASFAPDAELRDVAVDAPGGRALVTDDNGAIIWSVDLVSGAVAELPTAGAPLDGLSHIAVDASGARAWVARATAPLAQPTEILEVDLTDPEPTAAEPNVTVFSRSAAPAVGSGPALTRIEGMVVDGEGQRLLAVDSDPAGDDGEVLSIALGSGDRSVLSANAPGSGPELEEVDGIALDGARSRVLLLNDDGRALLAVDLATGRRTTVTDADRGDGPNLRGAEVLAVDGDRAVLLDESHRAAIAVDLRSGDRVISSK